MALQSLAETLFPLADASATQPRGKLHSPFSPLVGWLATLWGSEDRERAKMERVLVHDPDLFLSPGSSSDTLPSVHPTETAGMTLCDDGNDGDNDYDYDYDCDCDYDDGAPEMRISPIQPRKHGLTKEEFDYVVNSLLEYLEEAELSSPESGCEEYEYYAPGDTGCRPHHAPWSPESPLYLAHDSEDEESVSEAETLELDWVYDRASLELMRIQAELPDDEYPYQFEFELGGGGSDSE